MNWKRKISSSMDRGEDKHPKPVRIDNNKRFGGTLEDARKVHNLSTEAPHRTQDIIEIKRVHDNGIFEMADNTFTKSYYFYSGQYFLREDHQSFAEADERIRIGLGIDIQFTYIKRPLMKDQISDRLFLPDSSNAELAASLNEFISEKQVESNHGLEYIKLITLTSNKKKLKDAEIEFKDKENALREGLKGLNSHVSPLSTEDRLKLFRDFYRRKTDKPFDYESRLKGKKYDFRNDIAPLTFVQKPDYIKTGQNDYSRVFYALQYNDEIPHDLVHEILNLDCEVMISINHTPISKNAIDKKIAQISYDIERSMQKEQKNNNKNQYFRQPISARLKEQARKAAEIREDHEQQTSFYISVSIVLTADTLEDLDRASENLDGLGRGKGVIFEPCLYLQREGLATALPHGCRYIRTMREMVAPSAFVWHPYWSAEIIEHGVWYGNNQITSMPIIIDRRNLDNPHALVFGSSGAAKSGTVKIELMQILHKKMGQVIIFDPTLEYKPLVDAYGGAYVDVSMSSGVRINPLEIPYESMDSTSAKSEFIAGKAELFKRLLSECMDGKDTSMHRSCLDTAVSVMYDFFFSKKNKDKKQPVLKDLMNYIYKVPDIRMEERGSTKEESTDIYKSHEKTAEEVVESFKALTSGSINFFSEESNLDIWDNSLVTVGFSEVRGSLYNIAVTIFLDYVETIASRNMKKGIDTYFTIDELHELIKSEIISAHLTSRWKTARHKRMILTGILQDISNITENKECKQLLSNSSTVIILKQQASNLQIICKECNISEAEAGYAIDCKQGTGIVKFGSSLLPFDVRVPDKLMKGALKDIICTDTVTKGVGYNAKTT